MSKRKESPIITETMKAIKDNPREFMRSCSKTGRKVKVQASIAAAIYASSTLTDAALAAIQADLEGLDVLSERSAKNYYWAGRIILAANLTEANVQKVTLSALHARGERLIKAECYSFSKVVAQLAAWDNDAATKKAKKEAENKAKSEARKKAAQEASEHIDAEIVEAVADDPARTFAMLSVVFADTWEDWELVMGVEGDEVNYKTALKRLDKVIRAEAKVITEAAEAEAETEATAKVAAK